MNPRVLIRPAGVALLAALSGLALAAGASGAGGWRAALGSIKAAGFTSVEELESTSFGGFEAEVFDTQEQAFELELDRQGAIGHRRLEAVSSGEQRMPVDVALRLVDWLEAQGYRDVQSISADDGHIEVEAQSATGQHVELDLEAQTEGFKLLRTERN